MVSVVMYGECSSCWVHLGTVVPTDGGTRSDFLANLITNIDTVPETTTHLSKSSGETSCASFEQTTGFT